jgi:hypothetical protein
MVKKPSQLPTQAKRTEWSTEGWNLKLSGFDRMKNLKTGIVILFAFVLSYNGIAQRLRYKDVVPALDTITPSEQMLLLRAFLVEEAEQPNANLRLALLHYNIFRKSDPLLEYKKAMAHAKETTLRLAKAKALVTTSDVKSDNEYYAPIFRTVDAKGKPYVEFALVQQKMTNAMDSAQRFIDKMPAIYNAFTKSVTQYDQAVKTFAAINTDYKTLEDIYMLFDKDLDDRLENLKQSYDSSISYFKTYQSLIAEYPLKKYNQKSHIKSINVYRMDGLITALSFLTPDVEFWNYTEWVEAVRKAHKDEILGVKEKIVSTEMKLNASLANIPTTDVTVETLPKVSKDLVFQLNNYDKNSLALALLEYKAFKQHWLYKLKSVPKDSALDAKLQLYSTLIQINRGADTLLAHVKNASNVTNIRKHGSYVEKFYAGEAGLKKFLDAETGFINNTFSEYRDILQANLRQYNLTPEGVTRFVKINAFNVPLFIEKKSLAELDNIALLTKKISRLPDGSTYVAGLHKTNKKTNNNLIVYVARLNPDGKAAWIKELNFAPDSLPALDANNYIGDLVTTQEGCAVVVTSIRPSTTAVANNFVFINDKGEVKATRLKDKSMSRKLVYQESSNSFIMVFKGDSEKQQFREEPIAITSINILGDLLWHQDISLTGTFQDLIPVRDGFVLTGNYAVMKDEFNREVRTKIAQGQSNPFLIKLSLKGDKVHVRPFSTEKSIVIDKVVKVNDGSINLLGYEGVFTDDLNSSKGASVHLMTSYDLRTICSTF